MIFSHYQQAIFDHIKNPKAQNVIVNAVSGSGKTATLTEAARLLTAAGRTPLVFAFNRHIVSELVKRGLDATTNHSFGYGALRAEGGSFSIEERKYATLADEACKRVARQTLIQYGYASPWEMSRDLEALGNFARLTLTDPTDAVAIAAMATAYGLGWSPPILDALPAFLTRGASIAEDTGQIDFTDMTYLPIRWNVSVPQPDAILIDECMDLNAAQLGLLKRACGPNTFVMAVGDPNQSIMQFAGAGLDSFGDVQRTFDATSMPLSVCYRCPTSHLDLARTLVPHIEAAPGAAIGTLTNCKAEDVIDAAQPGDMILCRTTAPLVEACLAMIRARKPARVRGRDLGGDITRTVRAAFPDEGLEDFHTRLTDWAERQRQRLARRKADDSQIQALDDRTATAAAAYEGLDAPNTRAVFLRGLIDLFAPASDTLDAKVITLSTVHRAKGLEAARVYVLGPERMTTDSPASANVKYVSLTRSKNFMGLAALPPMPKPWD